MIVFKPKTAELAFFVRSFLAEVKRNRDFDFAMTLSQLIMVLVLGLVCLSFPGGTQWSLGQEIATAPAVNADRTWAFWESLNKAAVAGEGVEVLEKSSWKGKANDEDMANVFRDIVTTEQARSHAIESLPVLHVDPDLAAYAVQWVRTRAEIANLFSEAVDVVEQERTIMSSSNLAFGFFTQLLSHRNDAEGIVWNAFKDEAASTSAELQQLKPVASTLRDHASAVRSNISRTKADEMFLRVKLAQRFNREFPPMESYLASKTPTKVEVFSKDQIIRDMIGSKIEGWTFDSSQEFVSLQIDGVSDINSALIIYEIKTHVKGYLSGAEHDFHLRLSYGRLFTRWKLIQVQQLQ